MNALDDLLTNTGQVGAFDPTAISNGRTQLEDAVQSLHNSSSASASGSRERGRGRGRGIGLVSATGIAASAAVVLALAIGSHQPGNIHAATDSTHPTAATNPDPAVSDTPTQTTNTIELAGYRLALPANYELGHADTNCAADLQLSADETKRLVTTPAPGCPLLVNSVQRDLPPNVSKFFVGQGNHDGTLAASFTAWSSEQTNQVYLPTKLPDGTTVYVTLDGSDVGPAQANVYFGAGLHNITQLEEFEQGVTVTATSQLPISTVTPADKPTVNCDTSCGN